MKGRAIIGTFLCVVMLSACTPAEEEAAEQELDTLQTEVAGEIEEFQADAEMRLSDIDVSLDTLEAQAEAAGENAEAELAGTVAELREARDSVQRDLQQLGTASEAAYQDMRADLERRLDELEADIDSVYVELDGDDMNGEAQSL